jgi:hypothetical protein
MISNGVSHCILQDMHDAMTDTFFYQRKQAKTNRVLAIKPVAHKLARASYYILRDQVEFDLNKAFGS